MGRVRLKAASLLEEKGTTWLRCGMLGSIPIGSLQRSGYQFLWVHSFPLFAKEEGRLVSMHHPFTAPVERDIPILYTRPEEVGMAGCSIV